MENIKYYRSAHLETICYAVKDDKSVFVFHKGEWMRLGLLADELEKHWLEEVREITRLEQYVKFPDEFPET